MSLESHATTSPLWRLTSPESGDVGLRTGPPVTWLSSAVVGLLDSSALLLDSTTSRPLRSPPRPRSVSCSWLVDELTVVEVESLPGGRGYATRKRWPLLLGA
jgi:hypothetical protein